MIESIKDLGIVEEDKEEQIEQKIQEKLGVSLIEIKEALSASVINKAEEITLDLINIAPLGNYEKLIEDNEGMAEFLKTEGHKPEHWELHYISCGENDALIQFMFMNKAIDQGDTFKGLVYVSKSGKIRHAFAQGDV